MMGDFAKGRIHILVGTQMLSKGHNFKDMNTAVILGTDSLLNFPDFKAQERVYQTLTQVRRPLWPLCPKEDGSISRPWPQITPMYQTVKEGDFDEFYRSGIGLKGILWGPTLQEGRPDLSYGPQKRTP